MKENTKIWVCLSINFLSILSLSIVLFIFNSGQNEYFSYGPRKGLVLLNVEVDTWLKYNFLLIFIGFIKGCESLVNEVGYPILEFRVYNPDMRVIENFTKNELNFVTNMMWFLNNLRYLLMILINLTQFDIALFGIFISQIISIFVVRHLLNKKIYMKDVRNIV